MSMSEGVSVVIPHYGDEEPTRAVVAALLHQVEAPDIQIIISDDASPEPMPEVEGALVVHRERNGGFGAAVNTGAEHATCEFLMILNSDVDIEDTFIRDILAGAKPWMPAVISTVVREGGMERCVGRNWPSACSNTLETVDAFARLHGVMWFENLIGNDVKSWHSKRPELTDWAIGVCLLMPTEAFRAVGGIDERYFMNCEEIDLQRRLHEELGLPVVLLPAPVISHVGGGSSDSTRRSGWLTDARFRYHQKWVGGPGYYLAMRAANLSNLAFNGARELAGRDLDARAQFRAQAERINHGWATRK